MHKIVDTVNAAADYNITYFWALAIDLRGLE